MITETYDPAQIVHNTGPAINKQNSIPDFPERLLKQSAEVRSYTILNTGPANKNNS